MIKAFNYFGAKHKQVKNILPYLEIEHKRYVEVFGGSAMVLLNKNISKIEIYNDIYSEVVNFFRVIRNEAKLRKLQNFINNTPISREEFYKFRDTLEYTSVDWKRAAKFYYVSGLSFVYCMKSFMIGLRALGRLKNISDNLDKVRDRFRKVLIENWDWKEIFKLYDSEETLFYLDPPYMREVREEDPRGYKNDMENEDHELLIEKILFLRGKVILSGYQSDLYDTLLEHGYIRREFYNAHTARGISKKKDRNIKEQQAECLYLSPHFKDFEKRRNIFFK